MAAGPKAGKTLYWGPAAQTRGSAFACSLARLLAPSLARSLAPSLARSLPPALPRLLAVLLFRFLARLLACSLHSLASSVARSLAPLARSLALWLVLLLALWLACLRAVCVHHWLPGGGLLHTHLVRIQKCNYCPNFLTRTDCLSMFKKLDQRYSRPNYSRNS